ncbi:lipopolysaccharide N-acetylglucosaminyltransferase [Alteribacter lacisalsi]|uniref:Lipopolysaccharide N-acetylglucosaminyltransferase n=1 Tax=Alteribacter lacisalsi TaxID=2045244 RepID=A0A2W0HVN6_9BACI|nr:glycosyltransferase family 4 protein [Alteribacter lacisalsi]PYZ97748.1 lipopolysaccharide N-acetylglucosaminyltransferase [Alteribacter lacisalsi]
MKVAIVCTEKLPVPPIRGGAIQTYIAGALPSLKGRHDITVFGRSDPDLPDRETVEGVRYIRVPGGLLETYRDGLAEVFQDEKFDVIHIFNRPRLVRTLRAAVPGARLILSMHNDMFKTAKIDREEGEEAVAQVDKIITISDYIGSSITADYPEAAPKLKTIYSGVDVNRFVPASTSAGRKLRDEIRAEHNLGSRKLVMFAGRLSANKGADILLQAMPILAKKHSDVALVLVGSKWFSDNNVTDYVAYVRALAQRMPVPVITTGFVHPEEIHKWFSAADVFVCPSQWEEPLARVHYEAMAAGLPIVTTARGGNPEIIEPGKNGYVIQNPEDPQEFADRISEILSNSSSAKAMGAHGRKLAEARFVWSRVVSDILSVWTEMEQSIASGAPLGLGTAETTAPEADHDSMELIADETVAETEINDEVTADAEEVFEVEEEELIIPEPEPVEKIYRFTNNPPSNPKIWIESSANTQNRRKRRAG